jgi:hypothetical protein
MPGSSPSFHITGEVRIKNQDKDIAANLILQEIIIYRNNEEIIKFIPLFKYENNPGNLDTNDQINYNIKPGEEKNFSFNTNGNIKVNKELQDTQTADAVLKFSSAGKLYDYRIENIKVERIY